MAVLAELFLILAGFESGISQQSFLHPADAETFRLASKFGESVYKVRQLTSQIEHPVTGLLKANVVIPYLKALASLEAIVIAQLRDEVRIPLADSLHYSSRIMAQTIDVWSQKFNFSLELLNKLERPLLECHNWLSIFVDQNAGVTELRELGLQCIQQLDKQWLNELRDCINGENDDIYAHPVLSNESGSKVDSAGKSFPRFSYHETSSLSDRIEYLRSSIRRLKDAAFRDVSMLKTLIKLLDDVNVDLQNISVPLTPASLHQSLTDCQFKVSRVIRDHCTDATVTQNLLKLLRSVILCGSADFKERISTCDRDYEKALTKYLDLDQEINSEIRDLGMKIFRFKNSRLHLHLKKSDIKLQFLLSKDQCIIYENIFEMLVSIVLAAAQIQPGSGILANKYRLFLDELWRYYQERADMAMRAIDKCLQEDGVSIHHEHDMILKKLTKSMFLDSPEYRNLVACLPSADFNNNEYLKRVVTFLINNGGDNHYMNLAPFQLAEA